MEIRTTIRNYGKIEKLDIIAKNTRILLLKGPNGSGKTTLRTAFNEAISGKAIKTNPLKKGSESGEVIHEFKDDKGEVITITHNFNKFDEIGKFIIKDTNGKTYSTRQKLMSIMGSYDSRSIDDIWNLTRTVPGTREFIKTFIEPQMDEESRNELNKINEQLKEGVGELYVNRTVANKQLKNTKSLLGSYDIITKEELSKLSKLDIAKKKVAELLEEVERGQVFIQSMEEVNKRKNKIDDCVNNINNLELEVQISELAINKAKEKKISILSNSKLPKGLSFDDEKGIITYNGLPFTSTEVSESEAKLCIGELKCEVEKDAILLDMGSYGSYGKEKINEIRKLAKKYNKLVIMESVDDNLDEVTFVNILET